ncbi:MAG: ribonuclease R [Eubacteriales bacterium]|nr:ribonuclease R [Eubacteriales bacterium]
MNEKKINRITGRLQGNEQGFGFVIPEDREIKDIFIAAENLHGAMHNDTIIARIIKKSDGFRKNEGEIVQILNRANTSIVGTMDISGKIGFVIPDDRKLSSDIFIPPDEFNGAKQGSKVVVLIKRYPDSRRNAEGTVTEVLGGSYEAGVDILSVIRLHGLRDSFPDEVKQEAEGLPFEITDEMISNRLDLRTLRMVTIDGEDAKDLDDAVSIERLPNGDYRLGVHIADVSHFVREGSALDKEAYERGTSVYLADRVIPMLPTKLSNGVCSLNAHEDRLAFSVLMDIDQTGRVTAHKIFESVINVNERMNYTDVYKILEENDSYLSEKYRDLIADFIIMKKLALILKGKRSARGAIEFDFPETKVILDEKGKPVDIIKYEMTIANNIIEEFMLACNETVAEHFFAADTPFVYRVHADPNPEKLTAFGEFVSNLGYKFKSAGKISPKNLQELLEKVKGTKEELIINTVMLRSLQKALYSNQNEGHFGLAAEYYCHFTSPIRRYPDLLIHRIMKDKLKGFLSAEKAERLNEKLPEIAKQCSQREQESEEAERDTLDLKKAEYMSERIGQKFEGIISNVKSFGLFVELENTIEGLIRLSDINDDYYEFLENQYCVKGEHTGKTYRIGDTVEIIVARSNPSTRQIDFAFEEKTGDRTSGKKNYGGKSRKTNNANTGKVGKTPGGSGKTSPGIRSGKSPKSSSADKSHGRSGDSRKKSVGNRKKSGESRKKSSDRRWTKNL